MVPYGLEGPMRFGVITPVASKSSLLTQAQSSLFMKAQMVPFGWEQRRASGVKVVLDRMRSGFILIRPIAISNLEYLVRLF